MGESFCFQPEQHLDLTGVEHVRELWQPSKFSGDQLLANALNLCCDREIDEPHPSTLAPAARARIRNAMAPVMNCSGGGGRGGGGSECVV